MTRKIAIVAGDGVLPRRAAELCRSRGWEVYVLGLNGVTPPETVDGFEHGWVRLGAAVSGVDMIRRSGASHVCMVGRVRRPSLRELMPDFRTAAFLARIGISRLGDDGLLTAIGRLLEEKGLILMGVHELVDDLLVPEGLLTRAAPSDRDRTDIERGVAVARALGRMDVGQAVVVQEGLVLAVEAIEGTDAMIARAGDLRREGAGGVLVKAAKPQQDHRLDLPTIGVATIEGVRRAGLAGIAVEAGRTLIVDPAGVADAADAAGLFVVGWADHDGGEAGDDGAEGDPR